MIPRRGILTIRPEGIKPKTRFPIRISIGRIIALEPGGYAPCFCASRNHFPHCGGTHVSSGLALRSQPDVLPPQRDIPSETPVRAFTYDDYLSWPDGERWGLVDGLAYEWNPVGRDKLDPIPHGTPLVAQAGASAIHQRIVARLSAAESVAPGGRRRPSFSLKPARRCLIHGFHGHHRRRGRGAGVPAC